MQLSAQFSLSFSSHVFTYQGSTLRALGVSTTTEKLLLPARFSDSPFHDSGQVPNSGWKVQVLNYHLLSKAKQLKTHCTFAMN